MKKYIADTVMAAGLALSLILGSFNSFAQECEAVQDEVLRLHIPANSNSEYDQRIKLELRDFLLEKYSTELSAYTDLAAAEQKICALLPDIEQNCCAFLKEHGADYSAKAEITDMYFTTRAYDNVTLPAGTYTALRITLGSGEGQNWWCVMFPPLCIPLAADHTDAEALLPDELINTEENSRIEVKLALFELIKKLIGRD